MPDTVRWGVMGAALIAKTQLCPAIHLAAGGTLEAMASRVPDRVAPFVQQYPGLRVVEGYHALLADPEIDA